MLEKRSSLLIATSSIVALAIAWTAPGCTEVEGDVHNYYSLGGAPSTGGIPGDSEGFDSYPPTCLEEVPFSDLEIDLFGKDGHRFYFEITPEARLDGDNRTCSWGTDYHGSVYQLDDLSRTCPLAALNVRVLPAGEKTCADTGKVEVDLSGQSSFKPWAEIPNIKLDVGEFEDLTFPSGDRVLRFNNGQADSTIVREAVALSIWRQLGYPAPKTRFVQTQSNVWDTEVRPGVAAAHVLVQTYKAAFFEQSLPEVRHVWEGQGDPFVADYGCGPYGCCEGWDCGGGDIIIDPHGGEPFLDVAPPGGGFISRVGMQRGSFTGECQWSVDEECNEDAFDAVVAAIAEVPRGPGFMEATADYVDWPRLHQNQCLAALTGTGDDWIHNSNNTVIALLDNGKVVYLPYSTDISGGHPWYQYTPYQGYAGLPLSCQSDPECWETALDTCESLIDEFEELDVPTSIVDERCEALREARLDRAPDAAVCESLRTFYEERPAALREEIELLREGDGGGLGGAPGGLGGQGPIDEPPFLEVK